MDDADDVVQGIVLLKRGENPSVVLDQIHAKVAALNDGGLPEGMHMETNYDRSDLVGHTLGTVQHNLLFGATLIVGVLWLFLRSLRCGFHQKTELHNKILNSGGSPQHISFPH